MTSLSTILPFIRPLEPLLADPNVSEVMVNAGGRRVFVERSGLLHKTDVVLDERHLAVAIKNIARACGYETSEALPVLEARLEDGSRVSAVLLPCAVDGIILTIRKFARRYCVDELVDARMLTEGQVAQLRNAVSDRQNILISGGTGTGKTTLLNALLTLVPDEERIVVIEETAEISIDKPNIVRLEARTVPAAATSEATISSISIGDLLRTSLRHRPDRLIIGEVRGTEAWDLLQALNTGHQGSISTIHANSAEHALMRFAACVTSAQMGLPHSVVQKSIAAVAQLVVHTAREHGHRRVVEVLNQQR